MKNIGNVLILGDSYSTFEGFNPKGNNVWYQKGGHDRTDVTEVTQTWWYQLIQETQSNLVLNESFSGATVCNTERENIPHTSFIYRLNNLIERGFFKEKEINTVFVFGGTNDSWIDSPVGENKYENFTKEDLDFVLPAFCYLLKTLKTLLPKAKIVSLINTELKEEISKGFQKAIEKFEVTPVVFQEIGKNFRHPNILGMKQIKEEVLKVL